MNCSVAALLRGGTKCLLAQSCRAAVLGVSEPVFSPQENAGNDPSTQIVPVGNSGGWTKPEQPPPTAAPDTGEVPLAATSTWGSTAARSAAAPWQPPDAAISAPPALANELFRAKGTVVDRRRLNPAEYRSNSKSRTCSPARDQELGPCVTAIEPGAASAVTGRSPMGSLWISKLLLCIQFTRSSPSSPPSNCAGCCA